MTDGPGVWVELLEDDVVVRAVPRLVAHTSRVHLALPVERISDSGFARLTRVCQDAGLAVWLWPLFSVQDGYWLGEHNAQAVPDAVSALLEWRAARGGVTFDGISFDLEPAHEYASLLRRAKPWQLVPLLTRHIDPPAFARAHGHLARAIALLHAQSVSAHAVTFPLILDARPGDLALEDALDTPVSDLDWDEVSFMVYQTAFAQLLGWWLGPELVFSYAKSAVERFGTRAGLDLGVVGPAAVGLDDGFRYPSPDSLAQDIAGALAAGVPSQRLRVYGLSGMLDEGGLAPWLGAIAPPGRSATSRSEAEVEVEGVRNLARGLSLLLQAPIRTGTCSPARSSA